MRRAKDVAATIRYADLEAFYFFRLVNVALAQFSYDGLPDTCDRRYMELVALTRGAAAVYVPEGTDFWLSTGFMPFDGTHHPSQAAVTWYNDVFSETASRAYDRYFNSVNTFDVYGNPTRILGIGFNGEQSRPDGDKWGVFYDNMTREPLIIHIRRYAQLLAETHMTFRMNLRMQNKPYMVTSSRNKQYSFKQFFAALFNFEPVVEIAPGLDLTEAVQVLDLRVDYKGTELLENLKEIWNQALDMLGISTQSTKKERLLTGEIQMDRQADLITMNSRLMNRTEFWEKMNKRHGLNVKVKMSSADVDFESVFGDLIQYDPDHVNDTAKEVEE